MVEIIDEMMMEKLMGFSYHRTRDSYEAQELCSDIVFEIFKSMKKETKIENVYAYIFTVAHRVYADFCDRKTKEKERIVSDSEEQLLQIESRENEEVTEDDEKLDWIIKQIAFLSKSYREAMISFYLENKTVEEIARQQNCSEVAIRQRLFSARQEIRSEVEKMDTIKKPISFEQLEFTLIGCGNPCWEDPRMIFERQLSKHIAWACKEKAKTAKGISQEIGVPMMYVEEELNILVRGEKGNYGILQKTNNEKYRLNVLIFDSRQKNAAISIYDKYMEQICNEVVQFVDYHKEELCDKTLFLNKEVPLDLVIWLNVMNMAYMVPYLVSLKLKNNYMKDYPEHNRPFSIWGYLYDGYDYGCGSDSIGGNNICGIKKATITNIYNSYLNAHFHCGHDIANDRELQLAMLAINGIAIDSLNDSDKEISAKAVKNGYLYRDGDKLYTKILVFESKNHKKIFDRYTDELSQQFDEIANCLAKEIYELIKKEVPDYLKTEAVFVNSIASLPIVDTFISKLISCGLINKPVDEYSSAGCYMEVER